MSLFFRLLATVTWWSPPRFGAIGLLALACALFESAPAQAQGKCPDGRQITVSGPIKEIVRGTRSRALGTDVRHSSGCRIVYVVVKGDLPAACRVGGAVSATGLTFTSDFSFPHAQLEVTQVSCR